jgi:hypothetical protein
MVTYELHLNRRLLCFIDLSLPRKMENMEICAFAVFFSHDSMPCPSETSTSTVTESTMAHVDFGPLRVCFVLLWCATTVAYPEVHTYSIISTSIGLRIRAFAETSPVLSDPEHLSTCNVG